MINFYKLSYCYAVKKKISESRDPSFEMVHYTVAIES